MKYSAIEHKKEKNNYRINLKLSLAVSGMLIIWNLAALIIGLMLNYVPERVMHSLIVAGVNSCFAIAAIIPAIISVLYLIDKKDKINYLSLVIALLPVIFIVVYFINF